MEFAAKPEPLQLRRTLTLALPEFGRPPGPLHTILQDGGGTLYYTDEINHCVASLDPAGDLRWFRAAHGGGQGEFHYPKGLDLGWIVNNGGPIRCVAVADSFNHRVQFFDLDGGYLGVWNSAGENAFGEVVDIRYAGDQSGTDIDGPSWLVLDRGHHCVLTLDMNGRMLGKTGRPFYASLESNWPNPGDGQATCAANPECRPGSFPYDPLFMPLRLFGSSGEGLFVWEPVTRRLKQIMQNHLLPVWIEPPPDADWIAADETGFLVYCQAEHSLSAYDTDARIWKTLTVEGVPVSSGRSSREIWLQSGSQIQHYICQDPPGKASSKEAGPVVRARARFLDEIGQLLRSRYPESVLRQLQELGGRFVSLGEMDSGLEHLVPGSIPAKPLVPGIAALKQEFASVLSGLAEFSHELFLAHVRLEILQSMYPGMEAWNFISGALKSLQKATEPVVSVFERLVHCRDDYLLAHLDATEGSIQAQDLDARRDVTPAEFLSATIDAMASLSRWLWFVPSWEAYSRISPDSGISEGSGKSGYLPGHRPAFLFLQAGGGAVSLREIDRIPLGTDGQDMPVFPMSICCNRQMGILVSLYFADRIAQLDEGGRLSNLIGGDSTAGIAFRRPLGIATDGRNRVWVSEPDCNCLKIFDPETRQIKTLMEMADRPISLRYPMRLHRAGDRRILLADTHNHRLLAISESGNIEVLADRRGRGLGEFQHPIGFCGASSEMAFWTVDLRNHRLQECRLDGTSLRQIGGAGLGAGRLLLPEAAATFADGVLAVAQWACTKVLKLFSPDGDEIESVRLHYSPRGMLVHEGRLWVCEGHGNHIYVYERT